MIELNDRREEVAQSLNVSTVEEHSEIQKAVLKEEKRRQKKIDKQAEIEESLSYSIIRGIKTAMDDYFLDPIFSLVPGVGDIFVSVMILPYLYVSLFKVRSIPLTLAVLHNMLIDILIGVLPLVGNIADFFYKSYKRSYRLIVGFVMDDKEIIDEVNSKAFRMFIYIILLSVAIYYMVKLVSYIINSIFS